MQNISEIKISQFESRIRCKESLREFFFRKRKQIFLKDSCFNTQFLLSVLKGDKKLLPISANNVVELGRLKNNKMFDKKNLLNLIQNNEEMRKFIPDSPKYSRIERESMLKVSFTLRFIF